MTSISFYTSPQYPRSPATIILNSRWHFFKKSLRKLVVGSSQVGSADDDTLLWLDGGTFSRKKRINTQRNLISEEVGIIDDFWIDVDDKTQHGHKSKSLDRKRINVNSWIEF